MIISEHQIVALMAIAHEYIRLVSRLHDDKPDFACPEGANTASSLLDNIINQQSDELREIE